MTSAAFRTGTAGFHIISLISPYKCKYPLKGWDPYSMNILGIHGGVTLNQHEPNAALIRDGQLIVACEEERFIRVKSPRGHLPLNAVGACLEESGLVMEDVDLVVHAGETYDDMAVRIRDYLRHYFGFAPQLRLINHQLAHLASAFFGSGFDHAMCLSYDAYGDRLSGALAVGGADGLEIIETLPSDNSLGLFYATMTSYLGFRPAEDEYKVMGLAAYAADGPDLSSFARPVADGYQVDVGFLRQDPPNSSVFEPFYGSRLVDLLGPPRRPGEPPAQRHREIAFSTQRTLEACAVSLVTHLHERTGMSDLCLAGGIALNCSANRIIAALPFVRRLYVQPAASDRGLALGCALQGAFEAGTPVKGIEHVFTGPTYGSEDYANALKNFGQQYSELADPGETAARLLAEGKIVGWFQGRSEYGPRALGNRSIIADPRQARMKDEINVRVKFREEFRPFAPAVLAERAGELFDLTGPSPFMTVAYPVREGWKARLGAVTHVDGTGRVQTVDAGTAPGFHDLIRRFESATSVPAVLNTSFNVRGEPIVETPADALSTFARSGIDALVLDRFLVEKPRGRGP